MLEDATRTARNPLPAAQVGGRLAARDDSPLLGWRSSGHDKRDSTTGSIPGAFPENMYPNLDEDDDSSYNGRHSTDSGKPISL